jgi:hypothetical protein
MAESLRRPGDRAWSVRVRLEAWAAAVDSETDVEQAVDVLLRGIAADYPRLLEHSR